MPEIHSKLSPSSAARWLSCTPCLRLEESMPDTAGRDAQEGTLAHSLGEKTLLYKLGRITAQKYARALRRIKENPLYDETMTEYIDGYVEFVLNHFKDAKAISPDAVCEIEARLDFSDWAKGGFGTGDAVIITDGYIEVIDLKYGKGVAVDVDHNPQLMLYGLGAYSEYGMLFDIEKIIVNIYQPRINNIAGFEMPVAELLEWAEDVVRPQAEKALNGEGEFKPSEKACRFCKARSICKARAESLLSLETYGFSDPAVMKPDEIADVLKRAEGLDTWIKALKEFAYDKLSDGQSIKGFKLVKGGRGRRSFSDKDEVGKILLREGYQLEDIYSRDLISLTALEKLVGKKKFSELCGDYIIKPEPKSVLAFEDDPREEYGIVSFDSLD